jgi:opacity protein-like surface antigen
MNKFSPAFNVLLGYAFKVNYWHFGLEVDYLLSNIDTSFRHTDAGGHERFARVNSKDAFGAALRVGYHCDRMLSFVRLGLETRRFTVRANSFGLPAAPGQIERNTMDAGFRKTAFAPGVGFQFMLNKNISSTLEYRCAWYPKTSKDLTSQDTTTSFSIRPRVSTVLLSFRYHI